MSNGSHVAHRLLRGLARVGEYVHFDRSSGPVSDDPDRVDAGQAAELVFELAQLRGRVWALLRRQFVVRPLIRHHGTRRSRGPTTPARTQHTAKRPPSVGAGWCRCYLWGLRDDPIRVKLCAPFLKEDKKNVSGWRRQGLGLIPNELPEAKRCVRRAHSDCPRGRPKFQEVSCKRPWFALRPARQHWSQCCSPVALHAGARNKVAGALPSPPHS